MSYVLLLILVSQDGGVSQQTIPMTTKEVCESNAKTVVEELKKSNGNDMLKPPHVLRQVRSFCLPG